MRFLLAFLALAIALPAQAQEWWEAETSHFVVKSRDNEKRTREFAEELQRFDAALRTLQSLGGNEEQVGQANKVTIYRFGTTRDIAAIAGYPGSGIAGFYISRAGDSVAFVPAREDRRASSIVRRDQRTTLDGMSVLKHEYAHHFMMQYFPGAYPRWYVEGYAELVATIRFNDDGSFHVGDPPQYRSYQVMQMPGFRLREMLDANHELRGTDYIQHYATGWLLSHYLNFDEEGRTKLTEYLAALAAGEDSLTAAQRILGDLNALERKLFSYRRGRFPGLNVMPADSTLPQVTMRRMPADEVALIDQKMRLARGIRKKDATGIRNAILSRMSSHPDSVEAQLLLAEVSYDAEDYAAADQAAQKALELDPQAIRGLLYRGMAASKMAKDNPELANEARQYFARAAQLDRTDPRPLIGYYKTYLDNGQEPTEQAIIALETAYEYAGSSPEYRMLLARQLLTEDRFADARMVVLPVTFDGHATGEADADEGDPTPMRLLNAIQQQDAAAAIAMIDKFLNPDEDDEKKSILALSQS